MSTEPVGGFAAPSGDKRVLDPRLARSAKLRLYLVLRRVVDPGRMMAMRSDHLQWMLEKEGTGQIFLSGPVTSLGGETVLNGLSVIRAADADEARRIAEEEPYIQTGVMTYELCEWTVFEGSFPLTLTLSDSSLRFQ